MAVSLPKRVEHRLFGRLVAAACLLFFFYLALTTALAKAPATDEPLHLIGSVVLQQTGELTTQGEPAPLSHRLMGLLLVGEEQLPEVRQLSTWETGDRVQIAAQFLWESGLNVERILFLARLPVIWLGILLGSLVGSWALSWQGKWGMIVALILFASSPNLIAHSALVTTDLATAATYFAAVYIWWRYWQHRQIRWWLLTAVFLGLALAAKLTAILLLPVMFVLALLYIGRGRDFWRPIWTWLALLPPALLVLWLVYGLEIGPFANWPFAVPASTYLGSWQSLLNHLDGGHQSFFLGELSNRGWWTYFPVTFLIKTPLMLLLLLLVALWVVIRQRELWRTSLFLLLPVGALFAAAIASNLNIGYRHILPALPFLLSFSSTAVLFLRRWRITRILLGLGLFWVVISAVRHNPHHLAYFNEAVGGTSRGYRYLGDSNLDWGQDLNLLSKTIASDGGEWQVSYYGLGDPAYYGLPEEMLIDIEQGQETFAAANPPPGQYAISVNHLQGLIPDPDLFDWFWRQQPAYHLGGSIQVYEIERQVHGEWIAQCYDPTPLLTTAEAELLIGTNHLRHLFFDCRQSLVMAEDGAPGWLILPQADEWWFQALLDLDDLQLVYRHDAAGGTPSFDVYYWPGANGLPVAGMWKRTAQTETGEILALPHALNNYAELAGYQFEGEHWVTSWALTAKAEDPLSMQAHLYSSEDGPPAVGDALGFSSDQWRDGDWLLQRHQFSVQEDSLFLQTGLYNYQTVEIVGETVRLPAK